MTTEDPPDIDRIIAFICRRYGLGEADAKDFGSFVKRKLIENDYAIVRTFEGRTKRETFLTVVARRLFIDYQRSRPAAD